MKLPLTLTGDINLHRIKMKIFVIGGAGFLGSRLVPKLQQNNHEVTVLTRSREKALELEKRGLKAIVGDLLKPESFVNGSVRQDVIISVAMPDIKPARMTSKRFKILKEQTTAYFTTPISLARKFDCPLILTLGTSYRTTGDRVADESWPIERFGMTRIGEDVDPMIERVIENGSPPLIRMMPGEIYGPGGLFRELMYRWMKTGRYRVIGNGANYIPRIYVDDCAEAYAAVIEKMPLGESFIVADDGPCTQRDFADHLAECMGVPRPKSVPGFVIRIVMGDLLYETINMNCLVNNAKAKNLLGWKLKYPTYREGLPAAIKEIENGDANRGRYNN